MSGNLFLTLIASLIGFVYVARKFLTMRDILLILGMTGAFHSWALIVGLLFLTLESFYLGFIYRNRGRDMAAKLLNVFFQARSRTAFVVGIGLVVFVIFAMERGRQDVAAISEYIEIYAPNISVEPVWKVSPDLIGTLILTLEDSATTVLDFYERMARHDGWDVQSYSPPTFSSMQKANIKLTLVVNESSIGRFGRHYYIGKDT